MLEILKPYIFMLLNKSLRINGSIYDIMLGYEKLAGFWLGEAIRLMFHFSTEIGERHLVTLSPLQQNTFFFSLSI